MTIDRRTDQLMDHVESMLKIIEDMERDMQTRINEEKNDPNPSDSKISFYQSQQRRLAKLADSLEEDVLEMLIGIRNMSGPIEYFKD
jgi:hypothetical protein